MAEEYSQNQTPPADSQQPATAPTIPLQNQPSSQEEIAQQTTSPSETAPPQPTAPYEALPLQQSPMPYYTAPQQPYTPYDPRSERPIPPHATMPQQSFTTPPSHAMPQEPYGYQYSTQQQQPPAAAPNQTPYTASIYPNTVQQQKKKVWPWVVGICLLLTLLTIGGCVSCTVMTNAIISTSADHARNHNLTDRDFTDDSNNSPKSDTPDAKKPEQDKKTPHTDDETYTRQELEKDAEDLPNKAVNGRCTAGLFEVGYTKDIDPGLYYVEGNNSEESHFFIFEPTDIPDIYSFDNGIRYFGNYFVELEEGDLISLSIPDDARMYPAKNFYDTPQPPYENGLYRVGRDIPAGTYTITSHKESAHVAVHESAAYIMKDIDWDDDSVLETYYVIAGGKQTITLKDGQWLELYAAVATPA